MLRDHTGHHFTTEEAGFLLRLAVPITKALRAALTCVSSPTTGVAHGPGTLILDAHNAIQATTPAAARVRTRTPAGHWLTIHASHLTGMTVSPGTVAVTIQRAAPAEVAALIFHAHGLTARERQLARLLLDGLPNTEIAQRLCISTYTVRDHVKAVLDKLGVHSKREFIASILSQRL